MQKVLFRFLKKHDKMGAINVLLIEPDKNFANELINSFKDDQSFQFVYSPDLESAEEQLKVKVPQVIVSELVLPDSDGIELLDLVRRKLNSNALVVILTGVKDQYSQVTVFNHGADDFLNKPLNFRLFKKRLTALSRRLKAKPSDEVKEIGDVQIDYGRYMVVRNNSKVELQKKEFEIVDLLANEPGKVFTREEIKKQLWNDFEEVRNRTIDVHIRKLRSKLGDDFIHTIKGVGYRF